MSHLLDTNAVVDHLRRGPKSNVTARLLASPPGSIYLCSIVLGELIYGAVRSGPDHETKNRSMIAGLRAQFPTIPFDDTAAEVYGQLRAHLATSGQMIGSNDLMIAAIACANNMTLVTHNASKFSRVPALAIEDSQ